MSAFCGLKAQCPISVKLAMPLVHWMWHACFLWWTLRRRRSPSLKRIPPSLHTCINSIAWIQPSWWSRSAWGSGIAMNSYWSCADCRGQGLLDFVGISFDVLFPPSSWYRGNSRPWSDYLPQNLAVCKVHLVCQDYYPSRPPDSRIWTLGYYTRPCWHLSLMQICMCT